MDVTRRIPVAQWVALAILGAVAVLSYRSTDAADDTLGWVVHTQRVLRKVEDVWTAYAEAATAQRAYVLTGDDSQLPRVPGLEAPIAGALSELHAMVADNPAQQGRVDDFAALLRQRLDQLSAQVDDRRAGRAVAETAATLALSDSLRTARESIDGEENRLLAERCDRTRENIRQTKAFVIAATVVSLALLLITFRRLSQQVVRRERSEERLRAGQAELQKANRFLDSILENIPDMIFVKSSEELRFERINRAGEALLGVDRAALIGKNDFDFFPPAQAEEFQAKDRETLAQKVVVDIPEEPIETRSGARWLHTKKVPIVDERGVPRHLLGISEDVTERKREAEALKAAKEAAETASQELESFSYSVAHDLRAPLRAIDGFGLALHEDCGDRLDAVGLDHLTRIRSAAQHMGQLIDGLLGLSRMTRTELVREKVDLTRIAEQAAVRIREAQPQRAVDLVVHERLSGEGDPRLLAAAFDNLLSNAWKFTRQRNDARVEVGKLTRDGTAVFFVRDNGAGFDQAYAHKLFGAFQRLHTLKEFEGTGIGLATVHRIVRRHGGRIWAEGEVGRGATFYFTLG